MSILWPGNSTAHLLAPVSPSPPSPRSPGRTAASTTWELTAAAELHTRLVLALEGGLSDIAAKCAEAGVNMDSGKDLAATRRSSWHVGFYSHPQLIGNLFHMAVQLALFPHPDASDVAVQCNEQALQQADLFSEEASFTDADGMVVRVGGGYEVMYNNDPLSADLPHVSVGSGVSDRSRARTQAREIGAVATGRSDRSHSPAQFFRVLKSASVVPPVAQDSSGTSRRLTRTNSSTSGIRAASGSASSRASLGTRSVGVTPQRAKETLYDLRANTMASGASVPSPSHVMHSPGHLVAASPGSPRRSLRKSEAELMAVTSQSTPRQSVRKNQGVAVRQIAAPPPRSRGAISPGASPCSDPS